MAQNKKQSKVAVQTNLWETSLIQLQLISQVLGRQGQVGVFIQTAVDEYIERITETPKFAKRLQSLRAQNVARAEKVDSALDELVQMANRGIQVVEPKGQETVTPFPSRRE